MRFLQKQSLENFFYKIKNGHFKNVHFQKKTINNRMTFLSIKNLVIKIIVIYIICLIQDPGYITIHHLQIN